jgi:trk/ktr system potassium uptake protein
VARVKNALNAWLYEPDMGVDVLVSAPHTIAQLIEEQVAVGDVVQLLELAGGTSALLEATLDAASPLVGRPAGAVEWPPDCVPAAIVRDARVLAPPAEVVLEAGDRVLCVSDVAQLEPLHRLLAAPPRG